MDCDSSAFRPDGPGLRGDGDVWTRNAFLGKRLQESEQKAQQVLENADRQQATMLLEAKEETLQARTAADQDIRERRGEVQQQERGCPPGREPGAQVQRLGGSGARARRPREGPGRGAREWNNSSSNSWCSGGHRGSVSRGGPDQVVRKAEDEARHELTRKYWELEQQYKDEADDNARKYVVMAIERLAADVVAESTVTTVPLPNDEMKGRLIGREGRNIRALEQATGVDLIVDDTPEAVTLSCFDPIRREIARIALTKLIVDGRIHPARVEEMVEKARQEMDKILKEAGEQAVFEAGVRGLHPELIKQLGHLRFRTSYGSNVLKESVLAARIAAMLAAEVGANVEVCKAGALLHDIGKTMTHEIEGPHADIGGDIAEKYGVPEPIRRPSRSTTTATSPRWRPSSSLRQTPLRRPAPVPAATLSSTTSSGCRTSRRSPGASRAWRRSSPSRQAARSVSWSSPSRSATMKRRCSPATSPGRSRSLWSIPARSR